MSKMTKAEVTAAIADLFRARPYDNGLMTRLTSFFTDLLDTVGPGSIQELTATAAVTEGVTCLELNHATVVVAATIADAANHAGLFFVKDTSASGTAAHTLTLTSGTFDGSHNVATMNAPAESLLVYFDATGAGRVLLNTGSVGLS